MLYNLEVHLPDRVNMLLEDFRVGDITKLDNDKKILLKILSCYDNYDKRIGILDKEHETRKKPVLDKLENIEKERIKLLEQLDDIEKDYWESIMGLTTRVIQDNNIISDKDE